MSVQQTGYDPVINNRYVLIVEDSPIDFEIISRAFHRISFKPDIHHCKDGDEALSFLNKTTSPDSGCTTPGLVLLDLNLPGTDGRQVLSTIKTSHDLKEIPVVILSTSNNESDMEFCFSTGAEKYLQKPVSPNEFTETAEIIKSVWDSRVSD